MKTWHGQKNKQINKIIVQKRTFALRLKKNNRSLRGAIIGQLHDRCIENSDIFVSHAAAWDEEVIS